LPHQIVTGDEPAQKMIQAGADRIGASASVAIVTGRDEKKGTY